MQEKIKNIVVTSVFSLFLLTFAILCITCYFNPVAHSDSENRDLAQFPTEITWQGIVDKTVIEQFEDCSVDQFPFRELFRGVKAKFQYNVLGLKENNGYVEENGYICQIKNEFNNQAINSSINTINKLYESQIADKASNTYVSLIPDKNYYLGKDYGYPSPDYEMVAEMLKNAVSDGVYIDIFDDLELESFYKTDTHWDQSKIHDVLEKLSSTMGFEISGEYTENTIEGFEGIYYSQSAINPPKDTLTYLTNDIISNLKVQDVSNNKFLDVYALELFNEIFNAELDGYNVFLSGKAGHPMLRIINPKATNNKTLVVFRDSYGSSLAPLIAEGYRTVYVVDLRSIIYTTIGEKTMDNGARNPYYIDFTDKDVLFILSATVLESGSIKITKD